MMTLERLNGLPASDFVAALAGIFEHSPWVPERVAGRRPFAAVDALHAALCAAVDAASPAEQLALIRAHPRLGARGPRRESLTRASAGEQRRAGLDDATAQELERLAVLNDAYLEKFSFPFILAVRGHDPASILAAIERRLAADAATEHRAALDQIARIAGFRLADLLAATG